MVASTNNDIRNVTYSCCHVAALKMFHLYTYVAAIIENLLCPLSGQYPSTVYIGLSEEHKSGAGNVLMPGLQVYTVSGNL